MTRRVNVAIKTKVQVLDMNGDLAPGAIVNYKVFDETDVEVDSGVMAYTGSDAIFTATWTPNAVGTWTFEAYSAIPKFYKSFAYEVPAVDFPTIGTVTWLQATGVVEADLLDIPASVREVVINIEEMGAIELATQVITFRTYRLSGASWVFDDSVEMVPSEKDVLTLSNVHGHSKITMQPALVTVQNYILPYVIYYQ